MPAAAFGVLAVFTAASIAAGLLAWWLLGSRLPLGPVLPILAAFAALYVSGHRLRLEVGPSTELFGFQVSLAFDLALALAVALFVAVLGRLASGPRP
jgi:hypothetical protein